MRAVQFEKTWVEVGTPEVVTGFLKGDRQVHLVKVLENGKPGCWAALDDGNAFLFEDAERIVVENWIEDEVDEDAVEIDYWNERGQYAGLPMFSPSPGPLAHRVARARRKVTRKVATKTLAPRPLAELLEQKPVRKIKMPYTVKRGWSFE